MWYLNIFLNTYKMIKSCILKEKKTFCFIIKKYSKRIYIFVEISIK